MDKPLRFEYDAGADVLTVEGIKYAGSLFRSLGIASIGSRFEVTDRDDGIMTLRTLEAING